MYQGTKRGRVGFVDKRNREREREREEGWVKKNEENSKRARNYQEDIHSREQFDGISRLEGKSCTRIK